MTNPQPVEDAPFADEIQIATVMPANNRMTLDQIGRDRVSSEARLIVSLLQSDHLRPYLESLIIEKAQELIASTPREVVYVADTRRIRAVAKEVRTRTARFAMMIGALLGFLAALAYLLFELKPEPLFIFGADSLDYNVTQAVVQFGFRLLILAAATAVGAASGFVLGTAVTRLTTTLEVIDDHGRSYPIPGASTETLPATREV